MAVNYGKVRPFQLYEQKFHDQRFPMKYNLANMYRENPYYASQLVEKMFSTTYGTDIISEVNKYSTFVSEQPVYRWLGIGMTDKNIPLAGAWEDAAGTIPVGTNNQYVGANASHFYMDFNEKWFGVGQHIAGENPNKYRLWIVEQPVMISSSLFRYKLQLVGSDGVYIPKEELKLGTRWSADGGLMANMFSKEGYGTTFTAPFEFENRMSQFRTMISVPTSLYREGQFGNVYTFKFLDNEGKEHKVWFDSYWKSFLLQNRLDRARKFLFDKNNKLADGSTFNFDPTTGQAADEGSGLYELLDAGNVHPYYPGSLSSDFLTQIILDAAVGRVPEDQRDVTMMGGEYGLVELNKMMRKELIPTYLPAFMGDQSGRAFKWTGTNQVEANLGQVVGFASVNGIRVKFMKAAHKDDPIRNKKLYVGGGRVSSHEFDILDFGTTSGRPNIQKVELAGKPDIYAVQPGIGSKFLGNGTEFAPVVTGTPMDVDIFHYVSRVGSVVWNPTKNVRLVPAVLY